MTMEPTAQPFIVNRLFSFQRPSTLVVACSDGRLQMSVDEFLTHDFGIREYDRLYLPGGPGALANSGSEYTRSERHLREFTFLMDAHQISQVIFLFHGPSENGPADACCADYKRLFPDKSPDEIRAVQENDADQLRKDLGRYQDIAFHCFWAEVREDMRIQFRER